MPAACWAPIVDKCKISLNLGDHGGLIRVCVLPLVIQYHKPLRPILNGQPNSALGPTSLLLLCLGICVLGSLRNAESRLFLEGWCRHDKELAVEGNQYNADCGHHLEARPQGVISRLVDFGCGTTYISPCYRLNVRPYLWQPCTSLGSYQALKWMIHIKLIYAVTWRLRRFKRWSKPKTKSPFCRDRHNTTRWKMFMRCGFGETGGRAPTVLEVAPKLARLRRLPHHFNIFCKWNRLVVGLELQI